jgi:hypothetical protein
MLDMKVIKKKNLTRMPSILGYLLEVIINIWRFGKKIFEIWRIWTIFFTKNPFNSLKTYSSGRNLAKFRPKEKLHWTLAASTLIVLCSEI